MAIRRAAHRGGTIVQAETAPAERLGVARGARRAHQVTTASRVEVSRELRAVAEDPERRVGGTGAMQPPGRVAGRRVPVSSNDVKADGRGVRVTRGRSMTGGTALPAAMTSATEDRAGSGNGRTRTEAGALAETGVPRATGARTADTADPPLSVIGAEAPGIEAVDQTETVDDRTGAGLDPFVAAAGRSGTAAGRSGTAAGRSGTAAERAGAVAVRTGTSVGRLGTATGQTGAEGGPIGIPAALTAGGGLTAAVAGPIGTLVDPHVRVAALTEAGTTAIVAVGPVSRIADVTAGSGAPSAPSAITATGVTATPPGADAMNDRSGRADLVATLPTTAVTAVKAIGHGSALGTTDDRVRATTEAHRRRAGLVSATARVGQERGSAKGRATTSSTVTRSGRAPSGRATRTQRSRTAFRPATWTASPAQS